MLCERNPMSPFVCYAPRSMSATHVRLVQLLWVVVDLCLHAALVLVHFCFRLDIRTGPCL